MHFPHPLLPLPHRAMATTEASVLRASEIEVAPAMVTGDLWSELGKMQVQAKPPPDVMVAVPATIATEVFREQRHTVELTEDESPAWPALHALIEQEKDQSEIVKIHYREEPYATIATQRPLPMFLYYCSGGERLPAVSYAFRVDQNIEWKTVDPDTKLFEIAFGSLFSASLRLSAPHTSGPYTMAYHTDVCQRDAAYTYIVYVAFLYDSYTKKSVVQALNVFIVETKAT